MVRGGVLQCSWDISDLAWERPTRALVRMPEHPRMHENVLTIRFEADLIEMDRRVILRLPDNASQLLPSRGQVSVRGTINGSEFKSVLEPDGSSGHWLNVSDQLRDLANARVGDQLTIEIDPVKDWPEPDVPGDLAAALASAPDDIQSLWREITPMARWEWVRWVNATRNPETRERRVEVTISKMQNGKRRPCCFNLAACTDPDLSKNGKLLEPA